MLPVFWFIHSCQTTEALHALCNWNMITRFNDPLPITLKVIAMQPKYLRLLQMLTPEAIAKMLVACIAR